MSQFISRRIRVNALAAATALVLSASVVVPAYAAGRVNVAGLQGSQTNDRFIVKYREGSAQRADVAQVRAQFGRMTAAAAGTKVQHLHRMALGADVIRASRKLDRVEAEALMRQIAADPNVEYVEVDKLNHAMLTPNDPSYSQQWGYQSGTGGIKADQAWDVTNGSGSVVAVLDTGITSHSDLNANVIAGYDFIVDTGVSNDGNGRDSDASDPGDGYNAGECGAGVPAANSSWHGTHVAGTIGAVTNNAKGVAGVAYGAKIMPVRVLGKCGGYDSDIADAIIWASGGAVSGVPTNPNPAEVINLSLGGSGACSTTTQNAINSAVSRGTVLAIASGNDNADVSGFSPGNCNNVLSIASITSTGARSSFSNYGALIDFAAPGSSILSTINTGTRAPGAEGYTSYSGTSMATPHVAGVVALMQSAATTPKTPAQIEAILKSTARAFPTTPDRTIGAGIINAKAAVDAVTGGGGGGGGGVLTKGVPVTGLSAATGGELSYTIDVPAGSTNLVISTSGGTGDVDMYVKAGSAPTDTVYDCRPYQSGNAETCTIAAPVTGKYYVRLKAYSAFSGVSLVGNYTAGGGGGGAQTYTNGTDYTIADNATVDSPITVSGRTGNGPASATVAVNIVHTYRGDLKVDLVAPDGSLYNISNRAGGSADNIVGNFTFNLSTEALNGTWKLRVNDNAAGDTGRIDSWSVTF